MFLKQMDDGLEGIRSRFSQFVKIFPANHIVLDCAFHILCRQQHLDEVEPDAELMAYARGKKPQKHGSRWTEAKRIYFPVNYKNNHWILLVVEVEELQIRVYDSHRVYISDFELRILICQTRTGIDGYRAGINLDELKLMRKNP